MITLFVTNRLQPVFRDPDSHKAGANEVTTGSCLLSLPAVLSNPGISGVETFPTLIVISTNSSQLSRDNLEILFYAFKATTVIDLECEVNPGSW